MTKEMRLSHRIDVVMHAPLHYGHLTKLKLRKIHVVIYNLSYVSYSITSFKLLEESLQYKFIGTRDLSVTVIHYQVYFMMTCILYKIHFIRS